MNHLRRFFIALVLVAFAPIAAQALIQSQRSQIGVTIVINVSSPNPLGYHAAPAHNGSPGIVGTLRLRGASASIAHRFEAEQLHFTEMAPVTVAQSNAQHGVKVEASIAPNPLATLLYSDQTAVSVNVQAGTRATFGSPCVYQVYVHTAQTSWTLKHGLGFDFSDGAGHSFVGTDVANNSFIATPMPTSTPFVVYNNDGNVWANLGASGGIQTYCVVLTINVPASTTPGTYSSNAIYTLYY